MRSRRLLLIATALLVLVALPAANAGQAERGTHYGGSLNTTTPAGGTNEITSGDVPPSRDSVEILMGASARETQAFKTVTFTLMQFKSQAKRTVACAMMAAHTLRNTREQLIDSTVPMEEIDAIANTKALAYAVMCMRLARLMAELEAGIMTRPREAAATKCDLLPIAMKVRTERTEDGGFRLVTVGNPTNGKKALPVKVSCTGKARSMKVKMTAKKGTDVRKAVRGPVKLGIVSPSNATGDAHIKVGFK